MRIEERSDGLHISGYVNVTGKLSKPIITPHGRCIETIEERAFDHAIRNSGDITVNIDHDTGNVYARTSDGSLMLAEDAIGLRAEVTITDPIVIDMAKKGRIKGWSFGMYNVVDELEERADNLPLRHVKSFLLDHVTLVCNQTPCYAATSVEYRADDEKCIERRGIDTAVEIVKKADFSALKERIDKLCESRN